MSTWPTTRRMTQMTNANTMGVAKEDFDFLSEDERKFWDGLAIEIQAIKGKGMIVMPPRD